MIYKNVILLLKYHLNNSKMKTNQWYQVAAEKLFPNYSSCFLIHINPFGLALNFPGEEITTILSIGVSIFKAW